MIVLCLEDLAPGKRFAESTRIRIEENRLKDFAAEFNPEPFRLNTDAADAAIFRGLAARGGRTTAVTMQLLADSELKPAGGIVGTGFGEVRWPRRVRAP